MVLSVFALLVLPRSFSPPFNLAVFAAACRRQLGTKFEAMNLLKEFSRETKEKPDYLVHGSDEACSEDGEHQTGDLEVV